MVPSNGTISNIVAIQTCYKSNFGKAPFSWRLCHEGIDMAALPGQHCLASIAISALPDEPCQLAKLTLLGQECQTSMATPALPDQPNLALLS